MTTFHSSLGYWNLRLAEWFGISSFILFSLRFQNFWLSLMNFCPSRRVGCFQRCSFGWVTCPQLGRAWFDFSEHRRILTSQFFDCALAAEMPSSMSDKAPLYVELYCVPLADSEDWDWRSCCWSCSHCWLACHLKYLVAFSSPMNSWSAHSSSSMPMLGLTAIFHFGSRSHFVMRCFPGEMSRCWWMASRCFTVLDSTSWCCPTLRPSSSADNRLVGASIYQGFQYYVLALLVWSGVPSLTDSWVLVYCSSEPLIHASHWGFLAGIVFSSEEVDNELSDYSSHSPAGSIWCSWCHILAELPSFRSGVFCVRRWYLGHWCGLVLLACQEHSFCTTYFVLSVWDYIWVKARRPGCTGLGSALRQTSSR